MYADSAGREQHRRAEKRHTSAVPSACFSVPSAHFVAWRCLPSYEPAVYYCCVEGMGAIVMETAAEWLAAHKTAVAVSCLRSPSSSERVESLLLSHRTSAGLVCSCLQFPALPLPFFTTSLRSSLLYCGVAPPH